MTTETTNSKEFEAMFDHLQDDGFGGFEGINSSTISIPFIKILQQLSPELNKQKAEYVADAEQGEFFNNALGVSYEQPLTVVVGKFEHYFIEWKPKRGGFVGVHSPELVSERMENQMYVRDSENKIIDPTTGNILQETYVYYVVLPDFLEHGICIISLSSSQIKEAKKWNRKLISTFIPGSNKRAQPHFMKWQLSTISMSNDKGDWMGLKVDFEDFVDAPTLAIVSDERAQLPSRKVDFAMLEASSEDIIDVTPQNAKF